jgi:hypothetical protein
VESVLTAAELTVSVEGDSAVETATKISADIAGKSSAEAVIRSRSSLTISGTRRCPFAFTAVPLTVDASALISSVSLSETLRVAGATGVGITSAASYAALGAPNELLAIDE